MDPFLQDEAHSNVHAIAHFPSVEGPFDLLDVEASEPLKRETRSIEIEKPP